MSEKDHINIDFVFLFFGLGFLFIGATEYLFSRSIDSTHIGIFFKRYTDLFFSFRFEVFGVLGGILPDYIHPLSFSLLTMAIFPGAKNYVRALICGSWLIIDLLFELGQSLDLQIIGTLINLLPANHPLDLIKGYFLSGTYDHFDVLAIIAGSLTAFIISEFKWKGGTRNESYSKKR